MQADSISGQNKLTKHTLYSQGVFMEISSDIDVAPTLHEKLGRYRGALASLATKTGYSRQHVIDVLRGHRQNNYIVREAKKKLSELTDVPS